MFDITLQAFEFGAQANPEDNSMRLTAVCGFLLPASPKPAPIAIGQVHFLAARESAILYAQEITKAAESLPADPGIEIASSLQGVDKAAEFERKLREGK